MHTVRVYNYIGTHLLPQHVIESKRWSLDLCSCGFTTCIIICSKSPDVSFFMIYQLYVSNSSFVVGIKSCLHVGICRPLVEARAWFSSAQLHQAAVECEEQRYQKRQNCNCAQEELTIALAYNVNDTAKGLFFLAWKGQLGIAASVIRINYCNLASECYQTISPLTR